MILIFLIVTGIFYKLEKNSTYTGIEGRQLQAVNDSYDNVWELDAEENVEEFVISLEGEWKEYSGRKYVPDIPDTLIGRQETNQTKEQLISSKVDKGDLKEILDYLNPQGLNHKSLTSKGWNMRYGMTQINLKLVPLANYYFEDFENNPQSQIEFLKKYIDVKSSKGKTLKQIIQSYITGEDN